jgi:hypothetical protein
VVGYFAGGEGNIGSSNALFGTAAGQKSTGGSNTFIGHDSGWQVTTGAKNTILGRYNGNQGGLDIRTANNYIVLSDGDGNPRLVGDNLGNFGLGAAPSPTLALNSLQIGRAQFSGWAGVDYVVMSSNCYYTGSGGIWNYISTDAASRLSASGSGFNFGLAPSGTAGTTASFTDVLNVSLGGSLALRGAVSQTGTGITFPATQSASSNANTLDDYEEGTFTTTIAGETNVSAVTLTVGNYIKIGKQVTLFVKFGFTVTSANLYTYWNFTLPFTSDSVNDNAGACVENSVGRIGGVTTYGATTTQAYVVFPTASEVPSGTTSCYISYTYRATA